MGFFKDLKADFSAAINDLVPGGDAGYIDDEIPDDSQTLNQDIDTEAEFSKLDGLLEKVENKAKGNDDSAIFKPIEDITPNKKEPIIETVIEEDVVEEPVIEEPVIEEPVTEEPVTEATVTEATVTEATVENDWSAIEEEPLMEEASTAFDEADSTSSSESETTSFLDEMPSTLEPLKFDDWSDSNEDSTLSEEASDTIDEAFDTEEESLPVEDTITEEPVIDEEPIAVEETIAVEPIAVEETIAVEPIVLDSVKDEPNDYAFTFEEVTNNNSYKEENKMDEFTSITPEVTENKTAITEPEISLEISDEISVITEGTKIKGNMETTGSFEIRGQVEGDIKCNGKLTVTGTVLGGSSSSEFFADASHVEGEIVSSGTVKIGLGSVIIGNITATSAVIAGAVKGDIDVQGPVVVDSSAVILGNIKSKSVVINNGAVIEGFCSQCYSDVDVEGLFGKNK